jgi:hypothetical protein
MPNGGEHSQKSTIGMPYKVFIAETRKVKAKFVPNETICMSILPYCTKCLVRSFVRFQRPIRRTPSFYMPTPVSGKSRQLRLKTETRLIFQQRNMLNYSGGLEIQGTEALAHALVRKLSPCFNFSLWKPSRHRT